jgi:heme/copper-type cytochrome/quinol oxidase subunit 2
MFKKFPTGMRQQFISVATGLATLLTTIIWVAFGALVPDAGHAHIETREAVRADGLAAAAMQDEVAAWMAIHEQDSDGYYKATSWYLPIYTEAFRFLPERIAVEAGRQYYVKLATGDVSHGIRLQMPAGGSRTWSVMPGMGAAFLITFDEPGTYITAVCDVYCGIGHHEMIVEFKVVESFSTDA